MVLFSCFFPGCCSVKASREETGWQIPHASHSPGHGCPLPAALFKEQGKFLFKRGYFGGRARPGAKGDPRPHGKAGLLPIIRRAVFPVRTVTRLVNPCYGFWVSSSLSKRDFFQPRSERGSGWSHFPDPLPFPSVPGLFLRR